MTAQQKEALLKLAECYENREASIPADLYSNLLSNGIPASEGPEIEDGLPVDRFIDADEEIADALN